MPGQLSEPVAEDEELDDTQLEIVAGGVSEDSSKQKQIEDISKWGG